MKYLLCLFLLFTTSCYYRESSNLDYMGLAKAYAKLGYNGGRAAQRCEDTCAWEKIGDGENICKELSTFEGFWKYAQALKVEND